MSTSYGELVASFDDAAGDDDGPGGYTYPTNAAFEDGAFDLRSFEVYETADRYRFAFEVANLYDTFGGDNGFSPQHFVVWLRDPSATGGRNTELTGGASLDVAADFDANWHYRIDASGFGAGVVDADGVTVGAPELLVDLADNTVVLSVEKSVFGDIDLLNSEVCPVVGSEDNGRFREVDVTASEWTFGGAKSGAVDNAPGVIDLLTPTGTTQSAALTYSSTSRATLPFTPLYTDRLGDVDHVATFTDGAGDSYGPAADSNGTNAFTYPTTPDMVPDDYDIEQVDLYEGAGTYTFLVRLADLRNPDSFAANSVYGYGLQQLHLYLRDTAAGASNSYCRDGVHAYDDPQKVFAAPYHRRVVAHGFDRANETCGGTYPVVEDGDWNLVADADSGVTTTGHQPIDAIEVTIPSDAFPSDIRDVEFVPLLCSYDGDGAGDVRKVESPSNVADDFTFGGAPADYHHLNVLDMLVPAGTSQASVLDPTASDITADDDFDGYDIPFLSVSDGT